MLSSKEFWAQVELTAREVDAMAVWRSLSLKNKEKALQLLFGKDWRWLNKATIENYQNSIGR